MDNPILIKSFKAEEAIPPYRILVQGSAAAAAVVADSPNVPFLGISNGVVDTPAGQMVDVVRQGIREVQYGAVVNIGDALTSDATGRAVPATFDDDNPVHIIGYAEYDGVEDDIRPVEINKAIVPSSVVATETELLVANVTITSAELLALNATPKQLIAAPGANKAVIVEKVIASKAAGEAYAGIDGSEDVAIRYTDGSGTIQATVEATGFLDQATAQSRVAFGPSGATNLNPTANAAVVAHMTTGEITTGDSDLKLRILYRIIDTVL